ncbi:MAG: type 4a pilus biogenesis protein PilO [Candidatus Omnitrophica bacterium]|nr:type 4a pilus biogenesis protein PilO [Candidatus Omnitrophota bacterium]
MNPSLDKLKELEAKYLYMMLAGIILLFAVGDYALVMRSQVGLVGSLDSRIVKLRADIADLANNKQRLVQYNDQLEQARLARKNFSAMVHRKDEVPAVLKSISSIANDCGVKIDQLSPQAVSAAALVQNEDGKYHSMNIAVRVRSGFHQFGRFLNQLERARIFWQLEDFTVKADDKDLQRQEVKMNMKILILEK